MMAIWKWTEDFVDRRECAVEADTEEEARRKMEAGDWLYEHTTDFYSLEMIKDIERVEEKE